MIFSSQPAPDFAFVFLIEKTLEHGGDEDPVPQATSDLATSGAICAERLTSPLTSITESSCMHTVAAGLADA